MSEDIYRPDSFEEVKVGAVEETKIKEINAGKQDDFRTAAYWENTDSSKSAIAEAKESPAIEVVTENGGRMVVNLPADNVVKPRSVLGRFKRTYGSYPKVGTVVKTEIDKNGFHRVVLEQ